MTNTGYTDSSSTIDKLYAPVIPEQGALTPDDDKIPFRVDFEAVLLFQVQFTNCCINIRVTE
jgi:hypothetical protein